MLPPIGLDAQDVPQFVMLGTFLAYEGLVNHKLPIAVVLVGAMAIGGAVGWLEERLAIRPLRQRLRPATTPPPAGAATRWARPIAIT